MPRINNGLDIAREIAEQSDKDLIFGALSEAALVSIPEAERETYLPKGETQFGNNGDFMDCATRSPNNHLEALFTYHYQHNMKPENKAWLGASGYVQDERVTFSDRFVAMNSNTTKQGNSLKAPLEATRKQGLIPKKMLPKEEWMTFEDYHDKSKITQAMKDLGAEFVKRFTLKYEQVRQIHTGDVLKDDMVGVAGYAWPQPVNGIYPEADGEFNHAFLLYNLPKFQAFDNYEEAPDDFTKNLSPDYKFFDYGYRMYLSEENVPKKSWQEQLSDFFRQLLEKYQPPPVIAPPTPPAITVRQDTLYNAAKSYLGIDASPSDSAPDEFGCADSLSNVIHNAFPEMRFPIFLSTRTLYNYLLNSPSFERGAAQYGNIIISVTGTGNGRIPNGHCGIMGKNLSPNGTLWIMSNDSRSGTWEASYTLDGWRRYFEIKGGFQTHFFKPA